MFSFAKKISALVIVLVMALSLTACFGGGTPVETSSEEEIAAIDKLVASDYYGLSGYKDLTTDKTDVDEAKEDLWAQVLKNTESKGKALPEEVVDDYVNSMVKFYEEYAEKDGKSFEEYVGQSKEDFVVGAEEYAKASIKEELVVKLFIGGAFEDLNDSLDGFDDYKKELCTQLGIATEAELVTQFGEETLKKGFFREKAVDYVYALNTAK